MGFEQVSYYGTRFILCNLVVLANTMWLYIYLSLDHSIRSNQNLVDDKCTRWDNHSNAAVGLMILEIQGDKSHQFACEY